MTLEEKTYRLLVSQTFEQIQAAFEDVDPDLAECEDVQGALTITLQGRFKLVVSPQPSVQQIWLAVASEARAYHFAYHADLQKWLDDKTGEFELFSELAKAVEKATQQTVSF